MKLQNEFAAEHEDFIHDVAYDHYGKRLATCSADHRIKIWSENAAGEWQCEATLEGGHRDPVWKVKWAHPEFGQVLASCSSAQIGIWEEVDTPVSKFALEASNENQDHTNDDRSRQQKGSDGFSRWKSVATITAERNETVSDMKFSPRYFGLCLATCASDGFVRLYVVDDVMNLSNWTMSEKFQVSKEAVTCLSWNPSRFDSQMLVVGCPNEIKVWAKNHAERRWEVMVDLPSSNTSGVNDVCWAPNLGRSYHLIAAAVSSSESVEIWKLMWSEDTESYSVVESEAKLKSNCEIWRCEWNITGTVLAASGDDGSISMWRKNFQNRWDILTTQSVTD